MTIHNLSEPPPAANECDRPALRAYINRIGAKEKNFRKFVIEDEQAPDYGGMRRARRTDAAVEEFQRALVLNPNFAAAHGYMGLALALAGRSETAIEHCEQAIRMSPHDPQNAIFNTAIAAAHYLAGRFAEAVGFGRKALQQRTQFTSGHRIYIASLAQAGQIDEARQGFAKLKEMFPQMTIAWIKRYVPYTEDGPMEKFLDGMRKAGLE
jgi:tetratricopeptide (TPR) repeat protein